MEKKHTLRNAGILLATYTILFCILMAGIFALFITLGKSFIYDGDALDQGYFWVVEMKHNLQSIAGGNSYPVWSWDRGMGLDTKFPIDPFVIIAALFPFGSIELGYTVAIILRLYFAGLAFIIFCKEQKLDNFKALIGAVCYISATWTINLALMQGQYIDLFILFPLLVMSVDRIYKGKSPAFFIIIVGLTVAVNFYLAYMAAIVIIVYIFLRYFKFHTFSASEYSGFILRFILYGIAGIMTSAIFVVVTLLTLSGASTGSSASPPLLYDLSIYYSTGLTLLSKGYAVSYTPIGIPILLLLTMIAGGSKPTIKATHGIMALLLYAMTFFPFFGSMFNGFSYVSNRWYFMLIFFMTWCAVEHLDLDKLSRWYNILIMLICWGVLTVSTLGFSYYDLTGDLSKREAYFIGGNLLAGLFMIIVILAGKWILKPLKLRQAIITMAVVGTLIISWNISLNGRMDYFMDNGQVNQMLNRSTQRVGSMIEDDGFYRIDQIDWINIHRKADQPANENLQWQNNTIYIYDSKLPARLSLFNKLAGNNLGYAKRVYIQSNGNRMGLDFLYGVKYFLGNDYANEKTDSSEYAGYGFTLMDTIDDVEVFKSKYDSGLGFTYDACISESEFMKLGRLEREQALLQAVVLPDLEYSSASYGRKLTAADIDISIKDVPYEIIETDGVKVDGNTFYAEKEDATVKLHVENVENSQLVVSFDGLRRYNADGQEVGNFYLSCSNGKVKGFASNTQNNQTLPDIVDYDLNMGYYDNYSGNLNIKFNREGTYTFDRLYVSAMDAGNYDKYASEREKSHYNVTSRTDRLVTGSLEAPSDGYLFISIPVNRSWEIYIDGEKAEKITDANIAFMAAPITAGKHEVELRYSKKMRQIPLYITLAGLFLMLIYSIAGGKRRRRIREYLEGSPAQDDSFDEEAEETEEAKLNRERELFWSGVPVDEPEPKHGKREN